MAQVTTASTTSEETQSLVPVGATAWLPGIFGSVTVFVHRCKFRSSVPAGLAGRMLAEPSVSVVAMTTTGAG